MKVAIVSLSEPGARVAERLARELPGADVLLHRGVEALPDAPRFDRVGAEMPRLFREFDGIVCIMPCGVVVRAVAPLLEHKTLDPAVVVLDVLARHAVSLLSGHEGGANELALRVAEILGAEPVITTTSEAARTVIVGVGCRRGTPAAAIRSAVEEALRRADVAQEEVRLLASVDLKRDEAGLRRAAAQLGMLLRFLPSEEIRRSSREFTRSEFVQSQVDLPAVAEPAALLAGRRTRLLLPKQTFDGVTVAVAREDSTW